MIASRGHSKSDKGTSVSLLLGQCDQSMVTVRPVSGEDVSKVAGMDSDRHGQLSGNVKTHILSAVGKIAVLVEEMSSETDSRLWPQTRNELPCIPGGV